MSPAFPVLKLTPELTNPSLVDPEGFALLDVEWDAEGFALWATTKDFAPVSYSLPVLEELLKIGTYVEGLGRLAPEFVVYRSGHPSVFSLGGHLSYFSACIESRNLSLLQGYALKAIDAIWMAMTGCASPTTTTIALVEGEAQGGGFEAALACHLLVAEEGAKFGFPEALFGLFPGMGGARLLRSRGGEDLVEKLIAGASKISAEELYDRGIVDYLAKPKKGCALVREICAGGPGLAIEHARARFAKISKESLMEETNRWAQQAFALSKRDLKVIGYLSQAQERLLRPRPTVLAMRSR